MASAGGSRSASASARPQEHDPHFRPGRVGKTNVTGYFPKEVKTQLRMLAAEHETTIQALLAEALNDLFAKYGKPEIAPGDDHNDR
ncbi:MAG: ribbon-helix-helix domain-containing protein [Geminicoccaceae bacterium]